MNDTTLALDRIDKVYNPDGARPVHAVRSMSLELARGEIGALLGSSGCGKTSTLRMIAGFEEVTGGAITLRGRSIHAEPPARRNVAMAFEGYSLYPPLSVRDNIAFALKSRRLDPAQTAQRVAAIAELLEIDDILERYPSSLSGGQQQRAGLARALVRDADLYLLDEPMGQLEPRLRAVLRGRLKHYVKERGLTVILVTHDQTEANALADRIAVMEDGVLQQFASPATLRDRPANRFVGAFIGEPPMNLLPAEARVDGAGIVFALPGGAQLAYGPGEMASHVGEAALARGAVIVGMRPHAVRLSGAGLPARVVANQWIGDQSHVAVSFAERTVVVVEHERVTARSGETVGLSVGAGDLHVFDAGTGVALSHGDDLA